MNIQVVVAGILALAVLLGSARLLWLRRRQASAMRPRAWRSGVLLLAQVASAALLYFVLFPIPLAREAGTLVVLTGGAGELPADPPAGGRIVALPESAGGDMPGVKRFPDLASALRRYPATNRLRVVGAGLVMRDVDAARGHEVEYRAAPLPRGLVELQSPTQVPAGRRFEVSGRGERLKGGSAELLDPAGRRVDRMALDAEGRFELHATARIAGLADYRLQLRDARAKVIDELPVPLQVAPGHPLRLLVLAGAPSPELKFLRRWAVDAGARLDTRISLGAGMQIGSPPVGFGAEELDRLDLLVLDSRSWHALGGPERGALTAAVDRGLGLLLRLDDPPGASDREHLHALGFTALTGTPAQARLGGDLAGATDAADALPSLSRSGPGIEAIDGVPLLADATGTSLGAWRAYGRGRVGVLTLTDSYRLVLAGHEQVHGEVWSDAFTTLARPAAATPAVDIDAAAPGQRSVICGVGDGANVELPNGRRVALHIDPTSGADRCAGFWAEAAGWHRLHSAGVTMPFHVRDAASAPGLAAHAQRESTQSLVAATPASTVGRERQHALQPGPRWPWFIAWLLLTTVAWWFERSRWGKPRLM